MDSSSLQELEQIPGAGYTIARDTPHAVERSEIPTCRGMLYVFNWLRLHAARYTLSAVRDTSNQRRNTID